MNEPELKATLHCYHWQDGDEVCCCCEHVQKDIWDYDNCEYWKVNPDADFDSSDEGEPR